MVRSVIRWPNGRLHEVSKPVVEQSAEEIGSLVKDLFDTLHEAGGLGLSAIQIGVPLRVFVMDIDDYQRVFINPEVVKFQGEQMLVYEGCLSVPGVFAAVQRYPEIVIHTQDETGGQYATFLSGLESQCFQHELDHLDGKVFVQKLSAVEREQIRNRSKAARRRGK